MVKCKDCKKEMHIAHSCSEVFLYIKGSLRKRNTTYFDYNKRCHDCGIVNKKGNVHHLGCDMERCPVCKKQLISCGCLYK